MVGDMSLRTPQPGAFAVQWIVALGAANSIHAGEPTIKGEATGTSTGVVKAPADGDPLTTSTHQFSGLAKSESTDTAAAAGVVTCWFPLAGNIYAGKTKLSTDANTAAKVAALQDKRVVLDLTASVWTVDSAATDSKNNGVFIVGGDFRTQVIYFLVTSPATFMAAIAEA